MHECGLVFVELFPHPKQMTTRNDLALFPKSFLQNSLRIVKSFVVFIFSFILLLSLWSYNPKDPSFNTYTYLEPTNLLGYIGSFCADLFIQMWGIGSYLVVLVLIYISASLFLKKKILWSQIVFFFIFIVGVCFLLNGLSYKMSGLFHLPHPSLKWVALGCVFFGLWGSLYKISLRPPLKNKKPEIRDYQPRVEDPPLTVVLQPSAHQTTFSLEQLQKALEDFGVFGHILEQTIGPVVSSFLLKPHETIKLSRVIHLSHDLAHVLHVPSVRIVETADNNLLIEVAAHKPVPIFLENTLLIPPSVKIPLILGKDTSGHNVIADLTKLPHLLVGGAKGKTAFLNSLFYMEKYAKIWLIDDAKKGEWNDHPEALLEPSTALKKIIQEMEFRYRAMSQLNVRSIEEFNKRVQEKSFMVRRVQTGFDAETGKPIFEDQHLDYQPFAYRVIFVQELYSVVSQEEDQTYLQRCCSMAKAAGIHFIVSTSRTPSSIIQATFQARFIFKTGSRFESYSLIEGAEYLCDEGDALFRNGNIQRIHTFSG